MTTQELDAAIEKLMPRVQANANRWLFEAFGGTKSEAGEPVSYSSAMTIAYVFAATSIISGDVASLPLNYYRVEPDGDRILDRRHPAHWLLNGDASENMTAYVLRETMTNHALLTGNAYAKIVRDGRYVPVALQLLDPYEIEPKQDENGEVYYDHRTRAMATTYEPANILHVPGLGFDGLKGHSVITLARNSWGLQLAQDKHGSKHFANGASPRIVLKHPKPLNQEQADSLIDTFVKKNTGEMTGRPALAAGGLEIETLSVTNEDAQWLDSRKFSRVEIATWFQLPPHKLGDDSRVSYNSLESENRAYVAQTLRRWQKRWESEVNRKLVSDRVRRSYSGFLEHDNSQLLDPDTQTKADVWTKLREQKIVTGNEVREQFKMPKADGLDVFENPNTSSGANAEPPEAEPATTETAQQMRKLIKAQANRMLANECNSVKKAAKREFDAFGDWVDKFYATWTGKMSDAFECIFAAANSVPGITLAMSADDAAHEMTAESVAALKGIIGSSVDAEHLHQQVTTTINQWPERADVFASFILPEVRDV